MPKVVDALLGVNISSVSAGRTHTTAVSDFGEVYAWGSNEFGELGLVPPPPREAGKAEPYLTIRGRAAQAVYLSAQPDLLAESKFACKSLF